MRPAAKTTNRVATITFALDRIAAFQGSVQAFGGIRHKDKMRGTCGEGQRVALPRRFSLSQPERLFTSFQQLFVL